MTYLLRGALVEYGTDFLGPVPNVVIFQYNPETITRSFQIPERPSGSESRENNQAGEVPVENISFTAHFSAADELGESNVLAHTWGVGPRLAALEKMVVPSEGLPGAIEGIIDAIGDAISGSGGGAAQPIPRTPYPKILFIWGRKKVLPVTINSMRIEEKQYDPDLNPVLAEVSLELSVIHLDPLSRDMVARGAIEYTNVIKETQAAANLANTVGQVVDIFTF